MTENKLLDNKNEEKVHVNIKNSKRFWKYFWSTIIIIAIIFIILNITASKKLSEMNTVDREAKLELILSDFKLKFPEFIKMTDNLNTQSIEKIKKTIDENIDIAYEPLYSQVEHFSNFHYSVTGEYTELYTIIFKETEDILNDELFLPVKFNQRLDNSLNNINENSLLIIKEQLSKMKSEIKNKMNLNSDEIDFLFKKILKFSQEDMKNRFSHINGNIFKGMGLGVGAGLAMSKIISKKLATIISKKIMTKIAIKGGIKLSGVAGGALIGTETGLLCGPGALICSSAGAVVGGIIGWFATDKIVVEIDQYYNEDEFKEDIRSLINQQKSVTKDTLYSIYKGSFDKLSKENLNTLEQLKHKKVKDIMMN